FVWPALSRCLHSPDASLTMVTVRVSRTMAIRIILAGRPGGLRIMGVVGLDPNIMRDMALEAAMSGRPPTRRILIQISTAAPAGNFRDPCGRALKFFPIFRHGIFGRFQFPAKLSGVDRGFAKRANHNVLLKPTERLLDFLFALRAGKGKGFVAE